MKSVLTKIKIPEVFEIDGSVQATDGNITFDKHQYTGKIDNAILRINIESNIKVDGMEIAFKSTISHAFTDKELEKLMIILNSDNNGNENSNQSSSVLPKI